MDAMGGGGGSEPPAYVFFLFSPALSLQSCRFDFQLIMGLLLDPTKLMTC